MVNPRLSKPKSFGSNAGIGKAIGIDFKRARDYDVIIFN